MQLAIWPFKRSFEDAYFAERPVDLASLGDFRGDAFPPSGPLCWLDRPDAPDLIETRRAKGAISDEDAAICRTWVAEGYYVAPKLLDDATLDKAFGAYERAIVKGLIKPDPDPAGSQDKHLGRHLNPHRKIPQIRALARDRRMRRLVELLLGRPAVPFQTIIGHKGSQQLPHSDAIHMTTYPLGYLVANWVAFEDIHPDSGPLTYFPGSHRLPYLLSREAGISAEDFKQRRYAVYHERYEPAIQRLCDENGLRAQTFCARKGDVLFWHANLVHGGSLRNDLIHTRKALVTHYFAKGAFTYHDLAGTPTSLHDNKLYRPAGR